MHSKLRGSTTGAARGPKALIGSSSSSSSARTDRSSSRARRGLPGCVRPHRALMHLHPQIPPLCRAAQRGAAPVRPRRGDEDESRRARGTHLLEREALVAAAGRKVLEARVHRSCGGLAGARGEGAESTAGRSRAPSRKPSGRARLVLYRGSAGLGRLPYYTLPSTAASTA